MGRFKKIDDIFQPNVDVIRRWSEIGYLDDLNETPEVISILANLFENITKFLLENEDKYNHALTYVLDIIKKVVIKLFISGNINLVENINIKNIDFENLLLKLEKFGDEENVDISGWPNDYYLHSIENFINDFTEKIINKNN